MDKRGQLTLALDASQPSGSLALGSTTGIIYAAAFDIGITHSETLMPQIDHALRFSGYQPQDIKRILLANGPGSFTGLRIGLATAKGIAYANRCPLEAYSSLQLAALPRRACGKKILTVIDARMKEVYAALWDEDLQMLKEPSVCLPEEIMAWDIDDAWLVGNGSHLIPSSDKFTPADTSAYLSAAGLFALSALHATPAEYDFDYLAALQPFYLRDASAQVKSAEKHRQAMAKTIPTDTR